MKEDKPKATFITFYSFKGGVGRSMALINTAGILAGQRGFKVLVIDIDLEAPGLSYLNPSSPDESPALQRELQFVSGFVDLMTDAKDRGEDADLFALSAEDLASRYTKAIQLPEGLREFKDGTLHVMPAGKLDARYVDSLDSLNLRQLYRDGLGEPLVRAFKKKIAESGLYDYVLVDSRTGFSDEAGMCTRDLADHLMILSGLNRQNVEGTSEFLKALRAATDGKKTFQIILSPVPNGEDELYQQREDAAKAAFESAWNAEIWLGLQIPYHPQLALTEEPHIFRRRKGYLFDSYRSIERSMLQMLGHTPDAFFYEVIPALKRKEYPVALRTLWHMVRLEGGRGMLVRLIQELNAVHYNFFDTNTDGSHDELTLQALVDDDAAREIVEFIVEWTPSVEPHVFQSYLILTISKRYPELAESLYKRALAIDSKSAHYLCDYGQLLGSVGRLDEAQEKLSASFKLIEKSESGNTAEVCFSLWLVNLMQHRDATLWEKYFKFYIQQGFRRHRWNFERLLQKAKEFLTKEEYNYARALAAAFLHSKKVQALKKYNRWELLVPSDPNVAEPLMAGDGTD